jgi:hypothetical protein
MLLGCTEFTRVYLHIKDNPWPYVNLVQLAHNSGISDDEVIEHLAIAKGHLPRVRLEHDRILSDLNSRKAELNSITRTYQQFCDRNIELKNREDELVNTINELKTKKIELQKSLSHSEFQDNDTDNTNMILKAKLEEIISISDVSIQQSSIANNHYQNEVEPSSGKLVFDTKDLFR